MRLAHYPDRLGPSAKHFLSVMLLRLFYGLNYSPSPQLSNKYKELYIMFYFYVNKYVA
jgi:hypothetical protein